MSQSITLYVGLDVHKDSIDIATGRGRRATAKYAIWAAVAGGVAAAQGAAPAGQPGPPAACGLRSGPVRLRDLQRHLTALG